ncbi:MAG: polysaccharide biosynthesis/export family protein, partial [Phycisphaerae bacterium]
MLARSSRPIGLLLSLCWLAGCGPSRQDLEVFLASHEQVVSSGQYRVAPPDVIAISATLAPVIDGQVQPVRSDGKISLRLLGEVKVAGLSPKQI